MGLFITFEGIEGCGKSTQIRLLADHLAGFGHACVITREPGGTPVGEAIRGVFLNAGNTSLLPLTELLLVTAARVQHIHEVIRPALAAGSIVLCDRFSDATAAYQGYAGGIDLERIERAREIFCGGLRPDLTLLLDCPVELGLRRSRARNSSSGLEQAEGRFEEKDLSFHEKVRQGYLEIARGEPGRILTVDGSGTIGDLQARIRELVGPKLRERGYAV